MSVCINAMFVHGYKGAWCLAHTCLHGLRTVLPQLSCSSTPVTAHEWSLLRSASFARSTASRKQIPSGLGGLMHEPPGPLTRLLPSLAPFSCFSSWYSPFLPPCWKLCNSGSRMVHLEQMEFQSSPFRGGQVHITTLLWFESWEVPRDGLVACTKSVQNVCTFLSTQWNTPPQEAGMSYR